MFAVQHFHFSLQFWMHPSTSRELICSFVWVGIGMIYSLFSHCPICWLQKNGMYQWLVWYMKRKSCSSTGTTENWKGRCSFYSRGLFWPMWALLAVWYFASRTCSCAALAFPRKSGSKVGSSGEVTAVHLHKRCQFLCDMLCISLQIQSW